MFGLGFASSLCEQLVRAAWPCATSPARGWESDVGLVVRLRYWEVSRPFLFSPQCVLPTMEGSQGKRSPDQGQGKRDPDSQQSGRSERCVFCCEVIFVPTTVGGDIDPTTVGDLLIWFDYGRAVDC